LDFTLNRYRQLIKCLTDNGYHFQTFEEFSSHAKDKAVVLRHDVDKLPQKALEIAIIENKMGINASYYFRIVKESNEPEIIKRIIELGHEIGYHYEDLTMAKGDIDLAINMFEKNLKYFRTFYPVKTICMHGSPMSKWDNRQLWKKYNYKDFSIIAEPYFDIDYNRVLYLTDSGRSWNKTGAVIRDKVKTNLSYDINNTVDLIDKISKSLLPDKLIINTHPQRWSEPGMFWLKELVFQNLKNQVKRLYVRS
jgi:hypothetical protein